jgi:acetoin utilization protein AcuB
MGARMKVGEVMRTKLDTVQDSDTLGTAIKKLRERRIKHLPVLNSMGNLVGIVTDRDLKRANASDVGTLEIHDILYLLDRVKVRQIMTRNPLVARPEAGIGAAARIMVERGIGCLPIVKDRKLVGMLTTTDLLRRLAKIERE